MARIYDEPIFKLSEIMKRYVNAIKNDDILEMNQLKQEYPDLGTDEYHQYIRKWLSAFGVTDEFLEELYKATAESNVRLSPNLSLRTVR